MKSPVSIVIPAYNQLDYCKQCVMSILANTVHPYRLILVDNGSTDGVGEFFDSVPGATVVHAETNKGFAGGVNLGLERAEGHVLLLNSDTLVPAGWLERLVRVLDSVEDLGAVAPTTNYASGPQQIECPEFASLEEISAHADTIAEEKAAQTTFTDRVIAFCVLLRDRTVSDVGTFDEGFGIGNYEDDDYCIRIRQAGYRIAIAHDCFVFHYGSRTFVGMGYDQDSWGDLMSQNQERLFTKWGVETEDRPGQAEESKRLNRSAREAARDGQSAEAMRLLTEAIRVYPSLAENYSDLGALLWQIGQHEEAYRNFLRALRLEPDNEDAMANAREAAAALGKEAELDRILKEGRP
ncbi:MAG: glycosyltransferase [bacterium]|nr:glycosyltransferase [bacterium]